jgi:NADH-quinone oxidoreductase subunit N
VVALLAATASVISLAGTAELVFADAIAVDGVTLFLQGTIAVLGLAGIMLLSERSLDASGGAVVARAAVLPGSREDSRWPRRPRCRPRSTRSRCSASAG